MKARPILFSGPMVRAILDGSKTQTRRVVKPQPSNFVGGVNPKNTPKHPAPYFDSYCSERKSAVNPRGMSENWCWWTEDDRQGADWIKCLYGKPGDLLWLRETFAIECTREYHGMVSDAPPQDRPYCIVENCDGEGSDYWRIPHYAASDGEPMICDDGERTRWKPSIHMPRWASRLTLEITAVREERLRDISEEDARAEGIPNVEYCRFAKESFCDLWQSINGQESWSANPWVWVIEFKAHLCNVDDLLRERGESK